MIFRSVLSVLIPALLLWMTPLPSSAAEPQLANSPWPMFMHDSRHTGRATIDGPSTNAVQVLWSYKTLSRIKTSPAIGTDGTIYFGAGFSPICALNHTNGTLKWCTEGGGDASVSSPTIASNGTIYMGARDNKLWAVRDNGPGAPLVLWRYKIFLDGDILSSPAIDPHGDAVYMSCGCLSTGFVHALNPVAPPEGALLWDVQIPKSTRTSAPALDVTGGPYQGTLYTGSTDGSLSAFSTRSGGVPSGALKWAVFLGGKSTRNNSSPMIRNDGSICMGTTVGVFCVDPSDGHILPGWPFLTDGLVSATPALGADGTLYFGSERGTFYAVNPNGSLKWSMADLGRFRSSAAIGANGKIYAAGGKTVYCLNDKGGAGSIQWTYVTKSPIQWSSPAIGANKTLYIGSTDHYLYAFKEQ